MKNPDRDGFYRYLNVFRRTERDKDAFCEAARIQRDPFKNLDRVILDLSKRAERDMCFRELSYIPSLEYIRAIIEAQHAHELELAKLAAGKEEG